MFSNSGLRNAVMYWLASRCAMSSNNSLLEDERVRRVDDDQTRDAVGMV